MRTIEGENELRLTCAEAPEGVAVLRCETSDRGLPAPDAVFYLRLTPEQAQRRRPTQADRYENTPFQQRVFEQFERMAAARAWRVVDATQPPDAVAQQIADALRALPSPLGPLGVL